MAKENFPLFGQSPIGLHAQSLDWSKHPLGNIKSWNPTLKSTLSLIMCSKFPMFVTWGKEKWFFYNDAYSVILGDKHPAAFAKTFEQVWSDIWQEIKPTSDRIH